MSDQALYICEEAETCEAVTDAFGFECSHVIPHEHGAFCNYFCDGHCQTKAVTGGKCVEISNEEDQ